jgi:hypothetical protein
LDPDGTIAERPAAGHQPFRIGRDRHGRPWNRSVGDERLASKKRDILATDLTFRGIRSRS